MTRVRTDVTKVEFLAWRSDPLVRLVGAAVLTLTTGVALVSVGGAVLWASPILLTGHWFALKNSHGRIQMFWVVLAAATAAEATWLLIYATSESDDWPTMLIALGVGALVFLIGRRQRDNRGEEVH
jgi:hypothetical protein